MGGNERICANFTCLEGILRIDVVVRFHRFYGTVADGFIMWLGWQMSFVILCCCAWSWEVFVCDCFGGMVVVVGTVVRAILFGSSVERDHEGMIVGQVDV